MNKTPAAGYGFAQKSLHWIIFGLLAAQYFVGSAMPHIRRNTPDEGWVAWHVSIGTAILFFIIVRIGFRIARPVPLIPSTPKWQQALASLTHLTLYLLILVMCGLGWASASYYGWPVMLFGIIPLPHLVAKGNALGHTAGDIHDILLYVLLAPIALHIAAAFYHQYILRDGLLRRMWLGSAAS